MTKLDPLSLIDAEAREPLEQLMRNMPASLRNLSIEAIPVFRGLSFLAPPPDASPSIERRTLPGAFGAPDVTVYVVNGRPGEDRPAILNMHGGGFFAGSAPAELADLQVIANTLDCVIVTVEYRLAPEAPFPAALDDNYAALAWLFRHAGELGVDTGRIAIQGASAGAGHAAMLAVVARDRSEFPIQLQVLLQPMLDDRTGSSRQLPEHIGAYVWKPGHNAFGWRSLLGVEPGQPIIPRGSVPAREPDLSGLPPTYISVGAIDLFVEESTRYAASLCLAGVPTELHVLPGGYHGFDSIAPRATISRQYRLAHLNALARAFGRPALQEAPLHAAARLTP